MMLLFLVELSIYAKQHLTVSFISLLIGLFQKIL